MNCFIEEKIYNRSVDLEDKIEQYLKMSPEEIESETTKILGTFPNTCTFTKSMCERLIELKRGNLPVTICRPSIIGSSDVEPYPGWTDTISAAGALLLTVSLGIVGYLIGKAENVGDIVPVDFVSNCIIVAGAINAGKNQLQVVHLASSH